MYARKRLGVAILMGIALATYQLFPASAAGKPLRGSLYWEKRSKGLAVYSVETNQKHIAITFDDGPHPTYTRDILSALDAYHAKATFFVVGEYAVQFPQVLREMANKGHELGNHTFTHPQLTAMSPIEIQKCDQAILKATGKQASLLRPPGGRITDQTLWVARQTKHRLILWTWDVDTKDWTEPGIQKIVNVVVHHADPGDIVLFHDGGGNRQQTVEALRIILARLTKEGYQFVTVSQLLREQVKPPFSVPCPQPPITPEPNPPKE
ncbi:MAG: polysaccharide deacetylase family protein [Firmicutes bacterium]|nr:polysaccharide deacetylase family protein [Bacillota bacterium]